MISVVACTMREHMVKNILENFYRQTIIDKELILILNKNGIGVDIKKMENVHVFDLEESFTLGECLNFAVLQANFPVIAKFDDDDYYGPRYLENSLKLMEETEAEVVGKAAVFIYFKKQQLLTLFRPHLIHAFVKREFLSGATLCFQKEIWERVPFQKLNMGEDVQFQRDCLRKGIRIYSGGILDYAVIRYGEDHGHSWKVEDEALLKRCRRITLTQNFEDLVGGS